jgi:tetratricopeptide (TPR) repeat protein/tRNA A-37 threonylcarbamoyl transferase component Bud32
MPENPATVDEPLPPEQVLRVNDICDRFEAAWQATPPGRPGPSIEDHLAGTTGPVRSVLLRHLVLLEIDYRRLRGEVPAASDYDGRFPELSGRFLAEGLAPVPPAAPAQDGGGVFEVETTVLPPPLQPQVRSGRYAVGQFHARGGIGEVWLARDSEIGRRVALKRLRKKRLDQKERFLAEAQITGQLEHPGIVPVHDLGIDENGQAFYVMSFIRGRPLREAIEAHHAGGPASAEAREVERARLLEVFVKVCQAVAYAHHRGVIHRDIKPENVMLGPFGEALVLDWGMAKVLNQPELPAGAEPVQPTYSSGSGETGEGAVLGSPAYMAPEMAEGRAAAADERTDVYLLGATLYHILTGQAPRHGPSHSEVIELARTTPPPPPRRVKPDVPRALDAVCMKAMAHRPRDRYAGALALAEDMERYLAGAPVSAYREPLAMRAWRWCRRHRQALTRAAAVACVLALAVVAGVLVRDAWRQAEEARQQTAQLEREAKEREEERAREAALRQRREQAGRKLGKFRELAEDHYLHAAPLTSAGETAHFADRRTPEYFDSARGRQAVKEAAELADDLCREFDELGMAAERATLNGQLHDLLLVAARARTEQPPDRAAAAEILASLERAASLRGPTRSYHHLRARCYRALGDERRADEEEARGQAMAPRSLDHFLQAEEYRARAASPAESSLDAPALRWRPNPELLSLAAAEYQRAVRDEPNNCWYHLQQGRCYLSLDRGAEALEALDTCVALRPTEPWVYSARGLTLGLVKRYADGEADLDRALALNADFRPARLHHGLLALLQGKYDRALEDFARVLEPPEDQRLVEAAYYRGMLRLERREYQEAVKDFDLVVKDNPRFRPVYLLQAQALFLRGDASRGLADLTTFADLGRPHPYDPKDPALAAARGRLLVQLVPKWGGNPASPEDYLDRLRLTRKELEAAREKGHRSAELFDDLGSVAERLGEYDAALDAYAESLKLKGPTDLAVKVRTKRGWIFADPDRPQYDRARGEFTEAVRLDPDHADAHAGLGFVAAKRQSAGEAQREATLALNNEGDNYGVLHNVACIYAELSQVEKGQEKPHQDAAIDLLRRAVKLCRDGGNGDEEVRRIGVETSFEVLRRRPDFWKRLGAEAPK